jgi:branched-chain amino acid transport system permease protein
LRYFLQQSLNAAQVSCSYALLASAYVLVHGIANRINLAFGAIAMWGAYLTIGGIAIISTSYSIPFTAVAFAIFYSLIGTGALGYVVGRSVVLPLAGKPSLAMLIATIGLSIVLEELMRIANGGRELLLPPVLAGTLVEFPDPEFTIRISWIQALVFAVSLILAGGLAAFVRWHRLGRAWRACSQDLRMVSLLGIDPRPILAGTMVVGSVFAAASGIMIAIYYGSVSFYMGAVLGLKALYVAVIGGLNSLGGAVVGAFVLGFFESMWSGYFPGEYRNVASFLALTFLLIARPNGLFAPAHPTGDRV